MSLVPASTLNFLRTRLAALCVSQRFYPARGTKPLPRYEWDERHLKELLKDGYTHEPLRVNKLGGRDPETGHRVNQHVGGGVKFDYFVIDFHRRGPDDPENTYDEKVLEVRRDPNRSSHIALVAGANGKRWILATENMKAGQVISTSCHIPENTVIGVEGNAYPLGALNIGTYVNSVERYPTMDSECFIRAAGTAGQIIRHQGNFVVVRLPHKHEFSMHKTCMATVGRLSHAEFYQKQYGSAQMHRRFGYMPSSGVYHKKDGYCGRKVRPLPPVRVLDKPEEEPPRLFKFTLTKKQKSGLFGTAAVDPLISNAHHRF